IDTLRGLVLAPVGIARQRGLKARITRVRAVLSCRRPPRVPRRRRVAAVVVIIVVGWTLLGADAVAEWTRRDAVIAAAGGISVLPPDQLILGVLDVAAAVDAEAFGDHPSETDEPGVVLLIGGAGLARDIGGEAGDRARGAPRQHALQHGLELIEGG